MNEAVQNQPAAAPKTSGLAIASLVLAILGIFTCMTAPIALVLGIIALVQIGRNPQTLRGTGLALAGTIISGIAVLIAILLPILANPREKAKELTCMINVKSLCAAMNMYCNDYDGHYPLPTNWNEALSPRAYNTKTFVCPSAKSKDPSYAMNSKLSGISQAEVMTPDETVAIFESVPGKNQSGGSELLPSPPRHHGDNNVIGFADGHVRVVNKDMTRSLSWTRMRQ